MRALRPKPFELRTMAALIAVLAAHGARGEDTAAAFGVFESLAQGRFTLELRPRYNHIEESSKPERAEGGTVRVVAGWRSAHHGARLTFEAIHTDHFGRKAFNDDGALRASSAYPLLPDPRYSGLNQVHIEYGALEALRLRLGRQVVRLDNQRWVSDNDFRQIPQLFDGIRMVHTGFENTELTAGHFARVRGTSGTTSSLKLSTLRAAWNPARDHALAAYALFHDQAQNGAFTGFADSSYRVWGAKAQGAFPAFGAIVLPYIAEYAQQRPYADGDGRVHAIYWRLGAGLGSGAWTLRYDHEVKGSNAGLYGLQTPLTDFYAFNGWTLHFFNTPRQGLRDRWLTLRHSLHAVTLHGETHRFRSDYGGIDFGREHDLGVTYAFAGNCVLRLQHARYDPGRNTPDPSVRKTWLTLTYVY